MSNELTNAIFTEKFRPKRFDDLVFQDKQKLLNYLKNPQTLPSFLFVSKSPGTGKTSTAKLIVDYLKCDKLRLNASDERGIDVIREKIKIFARGLSSNNVKRCIFLDEADGLTGIAQNSLRNVMEEYSNNCFFILTCNNVHKIIEPIKSRCITFTFDKPFTDEICVYLQEICEKEDIDYTEASLEELVKIQYPNIRNCVKILQDCKISGNSLNAYLDTVQNFEELLEDIGRKDVKKIKDKVFKNEIDVVAFNNWYFKYLFNHSDFDDKDKKIIEILADNEKNFVLGINQDIVFLDGIIKIIIKEEENGKYNDN